MRVLSLIVSGSIAISQIASAQASEGLQIQGNPEQLVGALAVCDQRLQSFKIPSNIKEIKAQDVAAAFASYLLCWTEARDGVKIEDSNGLLNLELQKIVRDIGLPAANLITGRTGDVVAGGYYAAKVFAVDPAMDAIKKAIKVTRQGMEGIQVYNLKSENGSVSFTVARESFVRHDIVEGLFAAGNIRLYRRTKSYPIQIQVADGRIVSAQTKDASQHSTRVTLDGDRKFMMSNYGNVLQSLADKGIEVNRIVFMNDEEIEQVANILGSLDFKDAQFNPDEIKSMIKDVKEHNAWISKNLGATPELDFGLQHSDRFLKK